MSYWLQTWWQQLWCFHDWKWVRNLAADEAMLYRGCHSEWACRLCRHVQYRDTMMGSALHKK